MRGFDCEYALEPRAVQLYVRDSGYVFLSHVSYVTGTDATYSPIAMHDFEVFAAPPFVGLPLLRLPRYYSWSFRLQPLTISLIAGR